MEPTVLTLPEYTVVFELDYKLAWRVILAPRYILSQEPPCKFPGFRVAKQDFFANGFVYLIQNLNIYPVHSCFFFHISANSQL